MVTGVLLSVRLVKSQVAHAMQNEDIALAVTQNTQRIHPTLLVMRARILSQATVMTSSHSHNSNCQST